MPRQALPPEPRHACALLNVPRDLAKALMPARLASDAAARYNGAASVAAPAGGRMKVTIPSQPGVGVMGPSFGGYALVAACLAWLAGIALHGAGPLDSLTGLGWLSVGACTAIVWLVTRVAAFRRPGIARGPLASRVPALLVLLCWFAFGAARGAWSDQANGPSAIARLAWRWRYAATSARSRWPSAAVGCW
jgi:hypothetical protein